MAFKERYKAMHDERVAQENSARQAVMDSWDGESIEFRGVRYRLVDGVVNSEDDLLNDNPDFIMATDGFSIGAFMKWLGYTQPLYQQGFKRL